MAQSVQTISKLRTTIYNLNLGYTASSVLTQLCHQYLQLEENQEIGN